MLPRQKLLYCLVGNTAILGLVFGLVLACASDGSYWRFGPSDELVVISVRIDSWAKWGSLLLLIVLIQGSRVLVEEIGMPILQFNIYNPDKKKITEFTKIELQVYGNSMYLVSSLRSVFLTMVTIAQVDIAVWGVIISEAASMITIRMLLNEKDFVAANADYAPVEDDLELCETGVAG
jgi:hypothetical protein